MNQEITYAKWEAFLNGSLGIEEQHALQHALQNNTTLQDQLALYQQVRSAQNDVAFNRFQQAAKQAKTQYISSVDNARNKKNSRFRWMIAVAAVAAVAAVSVLLLWFLFKSAQPGSSTPQQLYAEYAIHDISLQQMSTDTDLGNIQNLLQNKQYSAALPLIDNYLENHAEAADIQLARGIALLEIDHLENALACFHELEEKHPIYANEAKWYQALTLIKNKQLSKAVTVLSSISSNSNRYAQAQDILKKTRKK